MEIRRRHRRGYLVVSKKMVEDALHPNHEHGVQIYEKQFRFKDVELKKLSYRIDTGSLGGTGLQRSNFTSRILRVAAREDEPPQPSSGAIFLIRLGQTKHRAEEAEGDLTEDFNRTVERHGVVAAQVGAWAQAITVPLFNFGRWALDWIARVLLVETIVSFFRH